MTLRALAPLFIVATVWPLAASGQVDDEEYEVHLWPFIEATTLPSGARRTSFLVFFHRTVLPSGEVYSYHLGPWFRGPGYKVLFPLAYEIGDQAGVVPFYFRGPGFSFAPPLLSGRWRHKDDSASTWVTPLFHRTVNADGTLQGMHLLNYFAGPDSKALFPAYWQWRREDGARRSCVPLLYSGRMDPSGDVYRSFLPPLIGYHRGDKLDNSLSFQLRPFTCQRAGSDYEFNFLWRLLHARREGTAMSADMAFLWHLERPAPGKPAEFQVLGGLFARDCRYRTGSYRYRILWFCPVGRRRFFEPATPAPEAGRLLRPGPAGPE